MLHCKFTNSRLSIIGLESTTLLCAHSPRQLLDLSRFLAVEREQNRTSSTLILSRIRVERHSSNVGGMSLNLKGPSTSNSSGRHFKQL